MGKALGTEQIAIKFLKECQKMAEGTHNRQIWEGYQSLLNQVLGSKTLIDGVQSSARKFVPNVGFCVKHGVTPNHFDALLGVERDMALGMGLEVRSTFDAFQAGGCTLGIAPQKAERMATMLGAQVEGDVVTKRYSQSFLERLGLKGKSAQPSRPISDDIIRASDTKPYEKQPRFTQRFYNEGVMPDSGGGPGLR